MLPDMAGVSKSKVWAASLRTSFTKLPGLDWFHDRVGLASERNE